MPPYPQPKLEPNILTAGMISFVLPDGFTLIIATAEAARKLRINQKRARKRVEAKHQIPVPQVNYGVLQVWRESREDSPIHAIGIEIWDGHNKLAVVQPVHCAGWLPSQVHDYLRQALTVLDTEYGFKKFASQILISPEQCPIRPCFVCQQ